MLLVLPGVPEQLGPPVRLVTPGILVQRGLPGLPQPLVPLGLLA